MRVGLRAGLSSAWYDEHLIAFALRVAVIPAFGDDVDFLPGMQADVIHKQRVGDRVPIHSMGIAQTVCKDFGSRALD